jgi:hypothetical protein
MNRSERRRHGLSCAGGPVCWICGDSAVGGWRVVIGEQGGSERLGWICDVCRELMRDQCPICQGEMEET